MNIIVKLLCVCIFVCFPGCSFKQQPVSVDGGPSTQSRLLDKEGTVIASMQAGQSQLTTLQLLGKRIFFDANLSSPQGQSCATCHHPSIGWTGPDPMINLVGAVYPGAVETRFGNRKPPTSSYAGFSPVLYYDTGEEMFIGGMFWDGRATGMRLGDPLAEQAQGPFLNPVEQNLDSPAEVCEKIRYSAYIDIFYEAFPDIARPLSCTDSADDVYDRIARALAAFQRSSEVSPFSSQYDYYLKSCISAGNDPDRCATGSGKKETLDPKNILAQVEWKGLQLFIAKNDNDGIREPGEGGICADCHVVEWVTDEAGSVVPPIFTDHTYDNIGAPQNPTNPFYDMPPDINPEGWEWVDRGLGGYLETVPEYASLAKGQYGKMKVPTIRNIDKKPNEGFHKSYGHNGYFKSLEDIVHFYNTRDVLPRCPESGGRQGVDCWPEPEIAVNMNMEELGKLALTEEDERAIVAFMKTLSDGYMFDQ